jgi:hypothetical protein
MSAEIAPLAGIELSGELTEEFYVGGLAGQIRPCWANHPEALWELTWLHHLWCRAYLTKRPDPKNAADWHDRWLPGVLRRLGTVMTGCDEACQSWPPAGQCSGTEDSR